jgi:hypothetical protein
MNDRAQDATVAMWNAPRVVRVLKKYSERNFRYPTSGPSMGKHVYISKVGLWNLKAISASVNPPTLLISESPNQSLWTWYVYLGIWAQLNGILHNPLPSVCESVCVARQRLGKHVPAAKNACSSRRIGWTRVSVGLCSPLSFLGNNSVKMFPRQQRIVGGVVFYAARVVSKKNM